MITTRYFSCFVGSAFAGWLWPSRSKWPRDRSVQNAITWWSGEAQLRQKKWSLRPIAKRLAFVPAFQTYCWWTKSCTTKDDDYPIIYRVLTCFNHPRWCRISSINSSVYVMIFFSTPKLLKNEAAISLSNFTKKPPNNSRQGYKLYTPED